MSKGRFAFIALVLTGLLVFAGLLGTGSDKSTPEPDAPITGQQADGAIAFAEGVEVNWIAYKAKKRADPPTYTDYVTAVDGLLKIDGAHPRAQDIVALHGRLSADRDAAFEADLAKLRRDAKAKEAAEAQARRNNVTGRKNYVERFEREMLKAGFDYTVTTEGRRSETLRIKYPLMNRPRVYQIMNESKLASTATDLGFEKIVLTDGFNTTWTYDLRPKAAR